MKDMIQMIYSGVYSPEGVVQRAITGLQAQNCGRGLDEFPTARKNIL